MARLGVGCVKKQGEKGTHPKLHSPQRRGTWNSAEGPSIIMNGHFKQKAPCVTACIILSSFTGELFFIIEAGLGVNQKSWAFSQGTMITKYIVKELFVSGCCDARWKLVGTQGMFCSRPSWPWTLECFQLYLCGLFHSSLAVMRWHSSTRRDSSQRLWSVHISKLRKKKKSNALKVLSRDYCRSSFWNIWTGT